MAGSHSYRVFEITLAIGASEIIDATGLYIACLESDGAFQLGIDGHTPQYINQGIQFTVEENNGFKQLRLINTSGVVNFLRLAVGDGSFRDGRLSLSSAITVDTITNPVDVNPVVVSALPDVTVTPDIPASIFEYQYRNIADAGNYVVTAVTNQVEVIIAADPANTGAIRIGSSVDVTKGLELQPGASISLRFAGSIYVTNESGATQAFTFLRIGT